MTQLQNLKHLVDDLNLPAPDAMAPDANAEMRFDWIAPSHVLIDRGYQRRISRASLAKIRKMVKAFDWRQFGAIIVVQNERDQYACIDGQHRLIAAYAVGATRVPAMVFHADHAQQAQAFVGVNVNRTSVASIDKFRARVAAGDPAATTVNDILTELNICTDVAPGYSLTPKQTRATAKLEKLVKAIGRGLTYTTLEMLTDAQPDQANLLTAFAIEATALALAQTVEQEGDLERLQRTLASIDFESLKDDAAHLVKLQGGANEPPRRSTNSAHLQQRPAEEGRAMTRVLIACETSGIARRAFTQQHPAFDVWSCDLDPAEDQTNRHIICDVRDGILNEGWDVLVVMHPPCTRLCRSGRRWMSGPGIWTHPKKLPKGRTWQSLKDEFEEGVEIFTACWNAPIDRVAIENPVMNDLAKMRMPSDLTAPHMTQPHWFGDPTYKETGWYLRGLPELKPTNPLPEPDRGSDEWKRWNRIHRMPPSPDRTRLRSRSSVEMMTAAAHQWGQHAINEMRKAA